MKKSLVFLTMLLTNMMLSAQEVFTMVYATSDDGFVNVREHPSSKAKILKQLYPVFDGLGSGVLIEKGDKWCKVSVMGVVGWAYSKYLGFQTWYDGRGDSVLIANSPQTTIYEDAEVEDGPLVVAKVKKGTILADMFMDDVEHYEGYYVLGTNGSGLLVRKEDAKIVTK